MTKTTYVWRDGAVVERPKRQPQAISPLFETNGDTADAMAYALSGMIGAELRRTWAYDPTAFFGETPPCFAPTTPDAAERERWFQAGRGSKAMSAISMLPWPSPPSALRISMDLARQLAEPLPPLTAEDEHPYTYVGPCTISITHVKSGETRSYEDTWHDAGVYMWGDGNYSCDCNRELFFEQAGSPLEDDDDDDEGETPHCGETRYRVKIVDPDGAVLYEDEAGR
jgi:hypothetical protein